MLLVKNCDGPKMCIFQSLDEDKETEVGPSDGSIGIVLNEEDIFFSLFKDWPSRKSRLFEDELLVLEHLFPVSQEVHNNPDKNVK